MNPKGLQEVDLEASSQAAWNRFRAGLIVKEAMFLRIWRGGAAKTPTRMRCKGCFWCEEECASARHVFEECPRFDGVRAEVMEEHSIPAG